MLINFREGIVDYDQTTPPFILSGTNVNLVIGSRPLILTIADQSSDYLFIESSGINSAWTLPSVTGTYWLYWDFNTLTFARTFGVTTLAPIVQASIPGSAFAGQYFYNTSTNEQFVYSGSVWIPALRVFACQYIGINSFISVGADSPLYTGTQIGDTTPNVEAGGVIFDYNDVPILKSDGTFFTTEDEVFVQGSAITGVRLESNVWTAQSSVSIGAYSIVAVNPDGTIRLASYADTGGTVVGMSLQNFTGPNSTGAVLLQGVVTNINWDWSGLIGQPLWVSYNSVPFSREIGTLQSVDPNLEDPITNFIPQGPVARVLTQNTIVFSQSAESVVTNEVSSSGSGSVTLVGITGGTGITATGSPITGSGTIALTLGTELQGLSNLSVAGLVTRTGVGTYTGTTLIAGSSKVIITNGNGIGGNPTIDINQLNLTLTSGQITSALGYTPGSVSSVQVFGSTGLTVSGSPITSTGTITIILATELQGLSALSANGFVQRTGTGTYTAAALTFSQITTALGFTPYNVTNPSGYIPANQNIVLNGDVSGSGTTAITTTLANSGVIAGSYVSANITIDAKGRIVSAADGSGSGTVTSVAATGSTGLSISGSPITTSGTITFTLGTELQGLNNLSVDGFVQRTGAGTYTSAAITSGQIATALGFTPGAGTVTSAAIAGSTGLGVSGSPITTNGTITLTLGVELQGLSNLSANGFVQRTGTGAYTAAALTSGQITTALGLTPGAGTVTSVAATGSTGLTVGGSPITTNGTITLTLGTELQGLSTLSTNGVVQRTGAGTYTSAAITSGQITTALGFTPGAGTVTSAAIAGSTGLGVSGSPITTSGTITLTLGTELQGLSALSSNGFVQRTGAGTYTSAAITSGQIATALGFTPGAGTVTSITVTGSTGLTVGGSPISSSGTITLTLSNNLQALSSLASTGFVVQTASNTFTERNILAGGSSTIVVTNGDGVSTSPTLDLATVSQGSSGTFQKFTVDSYGRVIDTTAVITSDITALANSVYVRQDGTSSMSGNLNLNGFLINNLGTPLVSTDAATKGYVDGIATGLTFKTAVQAASITNVNISSSPATIDSYSLTAGDRVLLMGQTTASEDGIYVYSATSSPLTRASDASTYSQLINAAVFVTNGTTFGGHGYLQTTTLTSFSGQTWILFAAFGSYVAGTGLTLSGSTFNVNLGSGITTDGSNNVEINLYNTSSGGLFLTTDGTTRSTATTAKLYLMLTSGGGLSQSSTGLTISATGVTNAMLANSSVSLAGDSGSGSVSLGGTLTVSGTSNRITTSVSSGTITLNISASYVGQTSITTLGTITSGTWTGSLIGTQYGGTGVNGSTATNGQLLIGNGSGYTLATLTGTTNQIAVTNASGSITLSLPAAITITTSLTVSGLIAKSFLYSGTAGLLSTTAAPTNGQLLIGSTGAAPVAAALTAGTAISVTNGAGSITIANTGVTSLIAGSNITISGATGDITISSTGGGGSGTVTSVALSDGSTTPIYSISGTPVTASGTLTFTLTTQTANKIFAGPVSGGAAQPTFRLLVAADLTGLVVSSIAGTANQITASVSTGAVTLSLPAAVTITTSLTVSGLTAKSFLYSGTAGLLSTTAAPTNGQLLIGSTGNAPVAATITAGTAISVTNGAGSITIANTGVTSLIGTANQITASASTGTITLSLPSAITIATTLTVSGLTGNSFLYSGTAGLLTTTTVPTNGQLLIGSTGAAPVVAALTAGTGITITNGAGSITISAAGVSSITGTVNQITASASTGAVTLSLPAAVTITTSLTISGLTPKAFLYSGTSGLLTTTAAPTNGQLLIGSTGNAPVVAAITAGTGISVTNGAGSIAIANTGVTSITGTANEVITSASTGAITLSLPQAIGTTSTPTFAEITITGTPTNPTDAATKAYVDANSGGGGPTGIFLCQITTSFAFGTGSPVSFASTLPANATIDNVKLIVDTPFNGTTPTASVGISGTPAKYMGTGDNNLKVAGVYEIEPGLLSDSSIESLLVTYTASASTAGAGRVLVTYSTSTSSSNDLQQIVASLVSGSSSTVTFASTLPANAIVDNVKLIVDTPFNGTAPVASVGISGNTTKYMATTDNNLLATGVYETLPGLVGDGSIETITITYTASASTAGAARIMLTYGIPS